MSKILCFLGWHTWRWSFREKGFNIPDDAKCIYCNKTYKK